VEKTSFPKSLDSGKIMCYTVLGNMDNTICLKIRVALFVRVRSSVVYAVCQTERASVASSVILLKTTEDGLFNSFIVL
jgi:hypothetical protein